jgi:hypothetical protein
MQLTEVTVTEVSGFAPREEIFPLRIAIYELNSTCFSGCRPIISCQKSCRDVNGFFANAERKVKRHVNKFNCHFKRRGWQQLIFTPQNILLTVATPFPLHNLSRPPFSSLPFVNIRHLAYLIYISSHQKGMWVYFFVSGHHTIYIYEIVIHNTRRDTFNNPQNHCMHLYLVQTQSIQYAHVNI